MMRPCFVGEQTSSARLVLASRSMRVSFSRSHFYKCIDATGPAQMLRLAVQPRSSVGHRGRNPNWELGQVRTKTRAYLESLRTGPPALNTGTEKRTSRTGRSARPRRGCNSRGAYCPQCSQQSSRVGTAFEALPQSDARACEGLQAWLEDQGAGKERKSV